MLNTFIYSDIIPDILFSIYGALKECISIGLNSDRLDESNPRLIKHFENLKGLDKHIYDGTFESHQERGKRFPRLLKLTINAFKEANEIKSRESFIIPSPLYILYYSLISPDRSQTAAYSLASCRTLLIETINVYIKKDREQSVGKIKSFDLTKVSEQDISEAMDSFTRHISIQLRWPKEFNNSPKSVINILVGHFLAMKGIAHLWFTSQKEAELYLGNAKASEIIEHMMLRISACRFRLANKYSGLPDSGEIINQLYGIPMPIKGAETVFFGGLKPASFGGLVISVSGQPGIGKTSFSLALANSLSPLGIKCFYLSLEEDEEDLIKRLKTLQPPYERELSIFKRKGDFFYVNKIKQTLKFDQFIILVQSINSKIALEREKNKGRGGYLSTCDSLIVIDNINEYFQETNYEKIEKLIEELRKLKALVVVISGEGIIESSKMEYLIDVGIRLEHDGINKKGEKPVRLFNLYKTRHQLSRQGTHLFHMSGDDGFRISPQIPSQMDRKERTKRNLHDESLVIDTLNYLNDDTNNVTLTRKLINHRLSKFAVEKSRFLQLFPRTHILVHGYGSAGKAGLALKLLLTPTIDSEFPPLKRVKNIRNIKYRRKVLILSFLYPQKYYDELIEGKSNSKVKKIGLRERINTIYRGLDNPIIEYLIFYPGYLTPEDFVIKITRKLDAAILEGEPFTGVLIDGLHNVFLQFPKLQKYDMVWPLLYNILSRYDVTVVSTFTNFALNDRLIDDDPNSKNKIINQALPDHLLMQKGMAPFLHALVKASDFYLFLEQIVVNGERKYLLSIKGAIGQDVPTELLEWDRQRNVFRKIYTYDEIASNNQDDKIVKVKLIE